MDVKNRRFGQMEPSVPDPWLTVLDMSHLQPLKHAVANYGYSFGKSARLLLAHADQQLRILLAAQFGRSGWVVHQFDDGIEFLEWLADDLILMGESGRSDLIIADIRLPGRNGVELLADLRRSGWSTPFILTARAGSRYPAARIRRCKHAFVFEAPFEVDDLLTASYYLLDRKPVRNNRRVALGRSP